MTSCCTRTFAPRTSSRSSSRRLRRRRSRTRRPRPGNPIRSSIRSTISGPVEETTRSTLASLTAGATGHGGRWNWDADARFEENRVHDAIDHLILAVPRDGMPVFDFDHPSIDPDAAADRRARSRAPRRVDAGRAQLRSVRSAGRPSSRRSRRAHDRLRAAPRRHRAFAGCAAPAKRAREPGARGAGFRGTGRPRRRSRSSMFRSRPRSTPMPQAASTRRVDSTAISRRRSAFHGTRCRA